MKSSLVNLIGIGLAGYGVFHVITRIPILYNITKATIKLFPQLFTAIILLYIIGFTALILAVKPVKHVPLSLYGFTAFLTTFILGYLFELHIISNGDTAIIPMLRELFTPELIYIPIAFLSSIIILSIRPLRGTINVVYASSYIKFLLTNLFIALPLIYFQGFLGIGFKLPKMSIFQALTMVFILIIFSVLGLTFIGSLIVRRAGAEGGYKRKRRFIHFTESYPGYRLDDKPTYYKTSDLHFRAYRIYRVYSGDLSQQSLEELLNRVRKLIIYYALDGYVYMIPVSEAYRLSKAVEKLDLAEHVITRSLDVDVVDRGDVDDQMISISPGSMPRDIPEEIDRDRLRFLVSEEALGSILVYEYEGSMSAGRFAPRKIYIKSGLYTINPNGVKKHITELKSGYKISSAQATVYAWDFLKLTTPIQMSDKYTPLYARKGRVHLDGSEQLITNIRIKPETVCIKPPLKHHIFLLGKTRSGKSVAIADLIKYINENTDSKIIIFDWVGNFIDIANEVGDGVVIRPGEDVFIDLFKIFTKRELIDLFEESSILFFKDIERASFAPIAYDILARSIEDAESYNQLLNNLNEIRETTPHKDERDASSAVLRRLRPLTEELYTPIEGVEGDILDYIDKYRVVVIDLASLPVDGDKVLFALSTLKMLSREWSSNKPELYAVIDEAHRLAPRIRGMREWILSRMARESGKYNIYLILADQTLTTVSPDVWNNMGHAYIFHIDNPDDLRMLYPLFSAWERRYKFSSHTLEEFIQSRTRLNPGEAYLIKFGGKSEPIECYFKYTKIVQTGEYKGIDENRFRRVIETIDLSRVPMRRQIIVSARKLIREYKDPYELINKVKESTHMNKLPVKIDMGKLTIPLISKEENEIKLRLPFRIYLAYHGIDVEAVLGELEK